jgi:hypothetical protein
VCCGVRFGNFCLLQDEFKVVLGEFHLGHFLIGEVCGGRVKLRELPGVYSIEALLLSQDSLLGRPGRHCEG